MQLELEGSFIVGKSNKIDKFLSKEDSQRISQAIQKLVTSEDEQL